MNVFISYAPADEKLAKKVGEGLKNAGLRVWDIRRELLPGELWSDSVSKALRSSDAMIVLVTPEAARSSQVRSEIDFALTKGAFKNRLIPVLIGPPDKIPKKGFPWILWEQQMVRLPEKGNQDAGIRQIAQTLVEAA
jgi:hypothetical protein